MKKILYLLATVMVPLCAARTPEETVQGIFAALSQGGLPAIVDFVHDYDLPEYRKYVSQTIDQFRARGPQDKNAQYVASHLRPDFEKLQGREYIKAGFSAIGGEDPKMLEGFRTISVQPLGHIREGNLAHVIVRLRASTPAGIKQEVRLFTVKEQSGDFWWVSGGAKGNNPFAQLFAK